MKSKIYDCVTFFDNNLMFDLRYNILKNVVDFFVICESKFDHQGNEKKINFINKKNYDSKKIKYYILETPFPKNNNAWQNQELQRKFLLESLKNVNPDDYIFFSDPDEIPRPELLIDFSLKKKFGIFLQRCFNYKLNLFNPHESPWEGTRVAKKKYLKSIDFMRQKIKSKNLNYSFLRFDKEKSVELFNEGGWHFNNVMDPKEISLKLKTFAHSEFSDPKFSDEQIIQDKIRRQLDLFDRGHKYFKIEIDKSFPQFIINNKIFYQKWIL
ncbi:glycosyl transferase family 17 [Candidatus Pelagibacter ubique]|jgi:beta-1,4-mannosyl-glycoprotein beta-1,4-N-acetylglucosaminyltransferase|nr:glycosyl transferase family 17 [Candidatus Pelagibacter ubique]